MTTWLPPQPPDHVHLEPFQEVVDLERVERLRGAAQGCRDVSSLLLIGGIVGAFVGFSTEALVACVVGFVAFRCAETYLSAKVYR